MNSTLIVGCGFLGRRVGKLLNESGHQVFGTTRTAEHAPDLVACGVEPVIANVLDPDTLKALPLVDRVLYCVGFDRTAGIPMRTVYVDGLQNVLTHLKGNPRLIYASSTGVYARDDGGWVDEDYPAEPCHEAGKVCLEAEQVATASHLQSTVLRFAGLYGPDRVMRRASLIAGEPVIGDPAKWLNVIHIDDAARVAVAALDHEHTDKLFVVSDNRPVQRSEFYAIAARCLGASPPEFVLPEPGSPEARREESNKRVSNQRMKQQLLADLTYPDIVTGLPQALGYVDSIAIAPIPSD